MTTPTGDTPMLTLTAKHDLARLQAAGLTVHSAESIAHGDRVTIVVDHDVLTRFADQVNPDAIAEAKDEGYRLGMKTGRAQGVRDAKELLLDNADSILKGVA